MTQGFKRLVNARVFERFDCFGDKFSGSDPVEYGQIRSDPSTIV